MKKYSVLIKNSAKKDLIKLKRSSLGKNFDDILNTLQVDPYKPTHSFEKLRPHSNNLYSRRLNYQHRVVYSVDEETKTVEIYSAWSHYE